jgi:hypothetical protein
MFAHVVWLCLLTALAVLTWRHLRRRTPDNRSDPPAASWPVETRRKVTQS